MATRKKAKPAPTKQEQREKRRVAIEGTDLELEEGSDQASGPCPCCGARTRTISGYVYKDMVPRAVYFMRWTEGKPEDDASLAVSIGKWANNAPASERATVGLESRLFDDGPSFMVVDAEDTPWGKDAFMGKKLSRDEALASPLSKEAFGIVDAVYEHDERAAPWFRGEG